MNRAYAVLNAKALSDDGRRLFSGLATTPTPDRMGDSIDPMGAQFKNPLPLLHQHDSRSPIGNVTFGRATKNGIPFEAEIPVITEAGLLKDRVDLAWAEIKAGLVRGVSIGFRPLEDGYEVMKSGGLKFTKYEVIELSAVTVPANADCTISVLRSLDTATRAAIGMAQTDDDRPPPGASGRSKPPVVPETNTVRKTYAEQIASFEATLKLKSDRMDDLMDKAAEEGATLDAAAREEYDDLALEVKSIGEHLVRLREREAANLAQARSVSDAAAAGAEGLSAARGSMAAAGSQALRIPAQVKALDLPKGTAFTRYVMALGCARGSRLEAAEIAKRWDNSTPEVAQVLKASINPGTTTDTTWAAPLVQYQNMASEFIELLRPQTILGRIDGFRRVPFNVKVPRQTAGASVNWVGETKMKPVSALAFDQITLTSAKIAGIVALSEELLRQSSPSAEAIVRADLTAAVAAFLDLEFVDPTKAEVPNVSPASVTYGVTPINASGTTSAALRTDIRALMATFLANNMSPAGGVWIMSAQQALAIGMMVTTLGQPEFPGINMNGGTLFGLPVITSENVPTVGNSPTDGSRIILVKATDILVADEGGVTIDMSAEASLQMDSTPDSPPTASTTFVSLWQQNMIGFKVERFINWKKRRDNAVAYINAALYAE